MPQLDPSSFTSQIFWLLICFFSLMFIMSKFIAPKISEIRKIRSNKIDGYIQKAEELRQKTENSIHKYETALEEATQKANKKIEKTQEELNSFIIDKQTKLDKKLQKQIKEGEEQIDHIKNEALKEIKNISAIIAAELLKKLEITDVSSTEIKNTINHEV